MKRWNWILAALGVFLLAMPVGDAGAQSAEGRHRALEIGQTVPPGLRADDQHGNSRTLSDLAGRSGLILLFTRSLDW